MRKDNPFRIRSIYVGLKPQEYQQFEQQYKNSTCRNMSEFIRKVLFQKPLTLFYRNKSIDDFIEEAAVLNQQINALKDLMALPRPSVCRDYENCRDKDLLVQTMALSLRMEEIKLQLEKITLKWLQ